MQGVRWAGGLQPKADRRDLRFRAPTATIAAAPEGNFLRTASRLRLGSKPCRTLTLTLFKHDYLVTTATTNRDSFYSLQRSQ